MGDEDGVLIALGSIRTAERKARRVERMQALINPFVDTHRKGKLTQEEITPIGVHLIKAAAACETVEHVSLDAWTTQPVEGLVHKKLRGQRQGTMGKSSAMQDHSSHSFACGDFFLSMPRHARVDHRNDP